MIFFGTRGVTSTVKEGDFHCPQCNNSQKFRHRKVRKFFTLYFIPLIPLESAGEYVECRNCKGTFIPRVLEQGNQNDEFMQSSHNFPKICSRIGVQYQADIPIFDSDSLLNARYETSILDKKVAKITVDTITKDEHAKESLQSSLMIEECIWCPDNLALRHVMNTREKEEIKPDDAVNNQTPLDDHHVLLERYVAHARLIIATFYCTQLQQTCAHVQREESDY